MIVSSRTKRARVHQRRKIEDEIKEIENETGNEMTKDDLLRHMFGDWDNYPGTELEIMVISKPKQKVTHRLNMLWVYPLTLALAPFSYILTGGIGWSNRTAIGRFIIRACGYNDQ